MGKRREQTVDVATGKGKRLLIKAASGAGAGAHRAQRHLAAGKNYKQFNNNTISCCSNENDDNNL